MLTEKKVRKVTPVSSQPGAQGAQMALPADGGNTAISGVTTWHAVGKLQFNARPAMQHLPIKAPDLKVAAQCLGQALAPPSCMLQSVILPPI